MRRNRKGDTIYLLGCVGEVSDRQATYQMGKTTLYTANLDSPALKALKKFQIEMADVEIKLQNREELKEAEGEKVPA